MKNVENFKVETIKSAVMSKEDYTELIKKIFGNNFVVNFSTYGIFIYPEYGILSRRDIYEDQLYKALENYFDVKEVKSVKYDSVNETVKVSVVDKENDKMIVPLKNGYFTAEKTTDPNHPGITIAFETDDGLVFDLALAEMKEGESLKDVDVYTYEDPYSEDWTNKFTIRSSDIEHVQQIENGENVNSKNTKDPTLLDVVRLMYDKKGLFEVINLDGEGIVCQENGLHPGFFYFNWEDLSFSGSGKEYVQEYGFKKVCEDITLALESMIYSSLAKQNALGYFLDMKSALTPEEFEKYGSIIDSYIENTLFLLKTKENSEEDVEEEKE